MSTTSEESSLPARARVVVIGGGVGGTSVAYHLATSGETDVVVLDRAELTSGSTFHSAGLVGQLRADPTLTRMNVYSVELYRQLQAGDHPPGWVECGGIKLASSPARMEEIRRQVSWARAFDVPLQEIGVAEAYERFPLMDTANVVGAAYLPTDGYLDPSQLCLSLAHAGRTAGVSIRPHTRVRDIVVTAGAVTGVRTDRGDVECEVVINCAGMYAAQVARLAGVRVPIVPMSHQYVITEPFLADALHRLPTLRDPDHLVYWRQEVRGLVMGGYEPSPMAFTANERTPDDIPADFNGRLLAPDWERFEVIAANAAARVPAMADVGLRRLINGPEGFTPDNEFCLGETSIAGFFIAAGFCAHGIAGAGGIGRVMAEWILTGDPGMDVSHMDIRRFGRGYESPGYTLARTREAYRTYYDVAYPSPEHVAGRPLRVSPVYDWHRAHGACFREKAGWERVDYYETNALDGDPGLRPSGWAGRHWSPAIQVEHTATREAAGLFDESSFAKLAVDGPDAAAFLEWVCDNTVARGNGVVTYTQLLNQRGGIESDLTVTRLGEREFLLVTGTASGSRDLAWLTSQARRNGADVHVRDVSGALCCFALWGPRAREVLQPLTGSDLSDTSFRFMTAQPVVVGPVPVLALRATFVGEPGWELYASSEYGAALWTTVLTAGEGAGVLPCGYRAIDSLRLEKGYRVWGSDVTPDTTPYQSGLGFCVRLDKPGGFIGADALRSPGSDTPQRTLGCLVLDDPRDVVLGSEPVRHDGAVVGRVTSGGLGYTLGRSLAYAYLPRELDEPGTRLQLDLFGDWVDATVTTTPPRRNPVPERQRPSLRRSAP